MTILSSWFDNLPKWASHLIVTLLGVLIIITAIVTLQSCSTIRISQTSTGEVKVTSNQSVLDSTKIEINVLNSKAK